MMNADYVETVVRLAGALVALGALEAGLGGRWPRMRQRLARVSASLRSTSRGSSEAAGPEQGKKSRSSRHGRRALIGDLVVALCLAILLFALAYLDLLDLRSAPQLTEPAQSRALADF